MRQMTLVGCGLTFALAIGCHPAPPPAQTASPELATPSDEYEVQLPEPATRETRLLHLAIGQEVDKTCDLEEPHFFYDDAEPRPQAHPEVKKLARCLNAEPYADLTVLLVGRADPRGTDEYNFELGKRRATQVKELLVEHGVDRGRIVVSSAGESQAKGEDDAYSYGYDRRVDVVQVGYSHAPRHGTPANLQQDYTRPE